MGSTIGGGSTSGAAGGGGAGAAADNAGDALFAGAGDAEGDAGVFSGAADDEEVGAALFAGVADDDVAGDAFFGDGAGFGGFCANAMPVENATHSNPVIAQTCARLDARVALDAGDM